MQDDAEGGLHNHDQDMIKQLKRENAELKEKVKQLTAELENRKTHTTNSMRSSYCQQQHSPQVINHHKGLLKLSVFKENNDPQPQELSQKNHKRVSPSPNSHEDSIHSRKKLDF